MPGSCFWDALFQEWAELGMGEREMAGPTIVVRVEMAGAAELEETEALEEQGETALPG